MAQIKIAFVDQDLNSKESTVVYPDAMVGDIPEAFAASYGWPAEVNNPDFDSSLDIDAVTNPMMITNPKTVEEFVVEKMVGFVMGVTKDFQSKKAEQAAKTAFDNGFAAVESVINISTVDVPAV
jgi:hypothetical protein